MVSSTNAFAVGLLSAKTRPVEGTVILAREQQAGRGRMGTQWHDSAGQSLCYSVILYPVFLSPATQFQLSQAVALAVLDLLRTQLNEQSADLSIKWPNDLYWKDRKLGGILIECAVSNLTVKSAVVGIGLNVNQEDFPTHLPNPASMHQAGGGIYHIEDLARKLCTHIEKRYLQLKSGRQENIKKDYLSHLYGMGVQRLFRAKSSIEHASFQGAICGIDPLGRLLVETTGGLEAFGMGEIEFAD